MTAAPSGPSALGGSATSSVAGSAAIAAARAATKRPTAAMLTFFVSLDVMGKPICHGVGDALEVLLSTGMDAVVIEDPLIAKNVEVLATALKAQGGIERA